MFSFIAATHGTHLAEYHAPQQAAYSTDSATGDTYTVIHAVSHITD